LLMLLRKQGLAIPEETLTLDEAFAALQENLQTTLRVQER